MASTVGRPFRLGDWTVRPRENRVERDGEGCTLEPKVMEVLVFLASRPGHVHLRQEILDAVWNGTFVTEEVLTNAVWELRRALGDDAREPRYIRTVSRRGYGLVAQVEALPESREPEDGRRSRWVARVGLVALGVVAGTAGVWLAVREVSSARWSEPFAVPPLETVPDAPAGPALGPVTPSGAPGPPAADERKVAGGWSFRIGHEVWSSPQWAGGMVLVGSDDGILYALDHRSGEERWRFDADGELREDMAVGEGRVLLATAGYVRAVALADGRELWRRRLPVISPLTRVERGAGMVVGGAYDRRFYALDPEDGSTLWSVPTRGENRTAAAVIGDTLAAGTDAGELLLIDLAGGRVSVRVDLRAPVAGLAAGPERDVLVATDSGFLYRITLDGVELWRRDLGSRLGVAPLLGDGLLYQGTGDGRLLALDPADGRTLWTFRALDALGALPRRVGDTLYVGSLDHHLYAVDAVSGAERWRFATGGWVVTRPLAVEDRIVFSGLDGVVRALPLKGPDRSEPAPEWPDPGHPRLVARGEGPTLLWRAQVAEPERLAATEDRLLLGTGSGVLALDAKSGERSWWFAASGGVGAEPSLIDARVVFGTLAGTAVALDVREGRELWRHDLEAGTLSAAAEAGGIVYLGDEKGRLHALDLETGAGLWRAATDHFINGSPLPLADLVVVGSCDEHVWAFDRFRGSLVWRTHAGECVVSDPVLHEGLAVYGSYGGEILALDVETGARKWTFTAGGHHVWYRPLLFDDTLFLGSGDYHVYALRAEDGEELWRFRTGNRALTEVARYGDSILFGSHDRRLYAVDRRTGEERWRLETTRPVSHLKVVGGSLYFVADDGWVLAYRLPGAVPGRS